MTWNIFLAKTLDDDTLESFLRLFCLLYADETITFSDSPEKLQSSLEIFANYCKEWKLTINTQKRNQKTN